MTNAVVQNNENSNDIILNTVINTNTKTAYSDKTKTGEFSNLLNNLSARTQKAQTNFVEKAIKTNTSSINKKALLSEKESAKKDVKDVDVNLQDVKTKKDIKENSNTLQTKTKKNSKNFDIQADNQTKTQKKNENNFSASQTDAIANDNKVELKENNSKGKIDNQSDINNSSLVESSPVFLSDEDVDNSEVTDKNVVQLTDVAIVLPTTGIGQSQSQIQDLKQKTEDIISNIATLDDVLTAVENIANILDESGLSEEQNKQLYEILDRVQNSLDEANVKNEFNGLLDEYKNFVSDFDSNAIEENQDVVYKIAETKVSLNNFEKDNFSKISEVLNEINSVLESGEFKNLDEVKDLFQDFQEKFNEQINFDSDVSKQDFKVLSDNIKNTLDEIKTKLDSISDISDVSSFKEQLNEIADFCEKYNEIKDVSNGNFNDNTAEINRLEKLSNQLNELIEGIDFSKLESGSLDEVSIKDMLDVFEKFESSVQDFEISQDLKNDIKKLSEQIAKLQDLNINEVNLNDVQKLTDKMVQVNNEVNKELKNIKIQNNIDLPEENVITGKNLIEGTQQNNNNTIDLTDVFDEQGKNAGFSDNFESNDFENQHTKQNLKNAIAFDKNEKVDVDTYKESTPIDDEVFLEQKQNFIKEIKEDILLDVDFGTIPEEAAALSVSDEVAKLAMDEAGVLKNDTTIKNSILYDSASGNAAVIQNAAQMIKSAQVSQNPILNQLNNSDLMSQIGEKLTQLKDGSSHKLTMVLRPNDLGRLSIELTSGNLGLTTNILAQNEDVRQYIEKNIHTLRQQLSDAGINVNSIQIKTAGQEGSTNYQGNLQNFEQNNENGQNAQNNHKNGSEQNQKEIHDTLLAMSNYDYSFAKDFSGVLNKTISYGLN